MYNDIQQFFSPTHKWAGQPRCRSRVVSDSLRGYQCDKRATRDHNTKCGVHCTEAAQKREAKRDARTAETLALWNRQHAVKRAQQSILAAVEVELAKPKNIDKDNITITISRSLAARALDLIK